MKATKDYTQEIPIYRYLDENGDGTGNKNANGDYSTTAQKFFIKPAAGEKFFLTRLMVHVVDTGVFDSGNYGNAIVLTNGIGLKVEGDSGVKIDITDGLPVMKNPDWARLCYDMSRSAYGSGDETLNARFTFLKSGVPIVLDGDKGEQLSIILNDDFSELVMHNFQVQGFKLRTIQ